MDLNQILKTVSLTGNIGQCVPDEHLISLNDLDFRQLFEMGIHHVIFDWDGTIVPYHTYEINKRTASTLAEMSSFGYSLAVLSNCTLDAKGRMEDSLKDAGLCIPVIRAFPEKKPATGAFYRAMDELGINYKPKEVAFIGDRILTDILGANIAGMYTVHVSEFNEQDSRSIHFMKKLDSALEYAGKGLKYLKKSSAR